MRTLGIVAMGFGVVVALAAIAGVLIWADHTEWLLPIPVLLVVYLWSGIMFLYYRQCRQDELLHVMLMTAEAELPLVPALGAYVDDRPHGDVREFWIAALLLFPFPGYYWLWHRRHSFDARVERVAMALDRGERLSHALQRNSGLASGDTVLAAAVGESTGRLAQCLRAVVPRRLTLSLVELFAPFGYPLPSIMLTLLSLPVLWGLFSFFVVPRMQAIFAQFRVELPPLSRMVFDSIGSAALVSALGLAGLTLLGLLLWASPTLRWFCPGVGHLYRQQVRSRVLAMLAVLLEMGKPVPESLELVAANMVGRVARGRLLAAAASARQGVSLAHCLLGTGLVSASMAPLVSAAERAGHLPWALEELGETLKARAVRLAQRLMILLFPIAVLAVAAAVAVFVIGVFLPLIKIITELAD